MAEPYPSASSRQGGTLAVAIFQTNRRRQERLTRHRCRFCLGDGGQNGVVGKYGVREGGRVLVTGGDSMVNCFHS
jgi:hypothetical protein